MTTPETLIALCRGEPVDAGLLLQTCRLAAGSNERHGAEEIFAAFRELPLDLGDARWIRDDASVAAVNPEHGLFADLVDGRVSRLWCVGGGHREPEFSGVVVPFDPDMSQASAASPFAPDGFPDLNPHALAQLAAVASRLEIGDRRGSPTARRTRATLIRAVGTPDEAVGLFAIVRGWRSEEPPPVFRHALVAVPLNGGEPHVVIDEYPTQTRTWAWSAPMAGGAGPETVD